uniref:HSBP1-like protein n=1 Tax=Cyanoderma ruficeps TaxID=181631 RepID=A0A8C3R976_9PASS
MTISSANKGLVVKDAPAPCGALRAGPCARCPPRRARGGGRRAGTGAGDGAGAETGADGGRRPAGSRGAAAAGERGRAGCPGCGAPVRPGPSASPVFISPLPSQAENVLCRLQENFQALTEKLTLRNILFGTWEMGERINDLEKRVADLMIEAGVENSNEELGVKTFT